MEKITGLIPEEELDHDLKGPNGGATPAIATGIGAITLVTAQTPCPSSACSKDC